MILSLLLTAPAQAGFTSAAVAADWCKAKTLHYLNRRGLRPYNWEATTARQGDRYVTRGIWSIDADEISVECTALRHGGLGAGRYHVLGIDVTEDDGSGSRDSASRLSRPESPGVRRHRTP